MKPYGVKRKDRGCCPGHDKFPPDSYNSNLSKRAHSKASKIAHQIARARAKKECSVDMCEVDVKCCMCNGTGVFLTELGEGRLAIERCENCQKFPNHKSAGEYVYELLMGMIKCHLGKNH
jgi:hypothetical protein